MSAARALATWFGCGLSPVAPGTVGSIGAVPLHLALRLANPWVHVAVVVLVTVVGTWSAQKVAEEEQLDDPQLVVIDEVAGVLIAMGLVRSRSFALQLAALALFRVLDIAKPGPIRAAENAKPAGVGIMADDLVAGAAAGVLARLLAR